MITSVALIRMNTALGGLETQDVRRLGRDHDSDATKFVER
jgi:hypothetical protein